MLSVFPVSPPVTSPLCCLFVVVALHQISTPLCLVSAWLSFLNLQPACHAAFACRVYVEDASPYWWLPEKSSRATVCPCCSQRWWPVRLGFCLVGPCPLCGNLRVTLKTMLLPALTEHCYYYSHFYFNRPLVGCFCRLVSLAIDSFATCAGGTWCQPVCCLLFLLHITAYPPVMLRAFVI